MQVFLRKMNIACSGLQISVAEQHLDGAQVGAGFEQVRCPTVAQSMRGDVFGDASLPRCIAAYVPDRLIGERHVRTSALAAPGNTYSFAFRQRPYPPRLS